MPRLTNSEIDTCEDSLGCTVPGLYRKLLVEIGHGTVSPTAEIYHPLSVRDLYEPFFDNPERLFAPYFPFGCEKYLQEIWVIDASRERAASIWHETVPDDWPEEEWLSYEDWVAKYLNPQLTDRDSSEPPNPQIPKSLNP